MDFAILIMCVVLSLILFIISIHCLSNEGKWGLSIKFELLVCMSCTIIVSSLKCISFKFPDIRIWKQKMGQRVKLLRVVRTEYPGHCS